MARHSYYLRRKPIAANIRTDTYPHFTPDMLVEMTAREFGEVMKAQGPLLTRYKPIDALEARRRVKGGDIHETGLYVDCDGRVRYAEGGVLMSNLSQPAAEWLREQFEFEWCAECGRDHRHHTAIPFNGNWFARCDLPPVYNADESDIVVNPEGYED